MKEDVSEQMTVSKIRCCNINYTVRPQVVQKTQNNYFLMEEL